MNQAEKPRPISASGQTPSPAGEGGIKSTPMTAWAAPGASRPQSPSSSPRASGKIAAKAGRMPSSPSSSPRGTSTGSRQRLASAEIYRGSSYADAERFRQGIQKRFRHAVRGEWQSLEAMPLTFGATETTASNEGRAATPQRPQTADAHEAKGPWSEQHRPTLLEWVRSTQETALGRTPDLTGDLDGGVLGSGAVTGRGPKVGGKGLVRASSAPGMSRKEAQARGSPQKGLQKSPPDARLARSESRPTTESMSRATLSDSTAKLRAYVQQSASELPLIPECRWGVESHERFRLYAELRCRESEAKLRAESSLAARRHGMTKLPYKCQLCHNGHELEVVGLRS